MKYMALISLSLFQLVIMLSVALVSTAAIAEIQVPESCVNRVSPCLVRSDSVKFDFAQGPVKVSLMKNSIIKITDENGHINFEILKGYISLDELAQADKTVSVNGVLLDSAKVFASRERSQVQIFSLSNFVMSEYHLNYQSNDFPERVKSVFLSKSELVEYSKSFFQQVGKFKLFLTSIEDEWKAEFKKQNESQTKVLLRSIASEEKEAELRLQKEERERAELKKVKNDFFFRTFNR